LCATRGRPPRLMHAKSPTALTQDRVRADLYRLREFVSILRHVARHRRARSQIRSGIWRTAEHTPNAPYDPRHNEKTYEADVANLDYPHRNRICRAQGQEGADAKRKYRLNQQTASPKTTCKGDPATQCEPGVAFLATSRRDDDCILRCLRLTVRRSSARVSPVGGQF
jgi:hypothetical protein